MKLPSYIVLHWWWGVMKEEETKNITRAGVAKKKEGKKKLKDVSRLMYAFTH
jgi:hypothetical protein